jgi:hypothetical protein
VIAVFGAVSDIATSSKFVIVVRTKGSVVTESAVEPLLEDL